jgi:hypothetical protein
MVISKPLAGSRQFESDRFPHYQSLAGPTAQERYRSLVTTPGLRPAITKFASLFSRATPNIGVPKYRDPGTSRALLHHAAQGHQVQRGHDI